MARTADNLKIVLTENNRKVMPVIVIAQFLCTSPWFLTSAIATYILADSNAHPENLIHLAGAVQLGFISGSLLFALFGIADRFSPSFIFFCCALAGAIINLGMILPDRNITQLIFMRGATGFFLAGIYPVGIKIAADYKTEGLGKSLGLLVGALVVGTALPHGLKLFSLNASWKYIVYLTSLFSILGGLMIFLFVPDGPYRPTQQKFKLSAITTIFKNHKLRSAAFGYFGHMWELYTLWAFIPVILTNTLSGKSYSLNITGLSFLIIASGACACLISGWLSSRIFPTQIARTCLFLSTICALLSPLILRNGSPVFFIVFLFFWSAVAVADSPMFSTLIASSTPAALKGTTITIVTCLGYLITIISMEMVTRLDDAYRLMALSIGPAIGLVSMMGRKTIKEVNPE